MSHDFKNAQISQLYDIIYNTILITTYWLDHIRWEYNFLPVCNDTKKDHLFSLLEEHTVCYLVLKIDMIK